MSNQQQQIKSILLERLETYREMMVENKDLLDQLIAHTNTATIDMALLSRLDDIMEDIATLNTDTKSLLHGLSSLEGLTLSVREPERIAFRHRLKMILPWLFSSAF
jgi:hypothetical protein